MEERSPLLAPDHPDRVKKWRTCLGCGKRMFTDRGHRICKKCRRRNNASPNRHAYSVGASGREASMSAPSSVLDF